MPFFVKIVADDHGFVIDGKCLRRMPKGFKRRYFIIGTANETAEKVLLYPKITGDCPMVVDAHGVGVMTARRIEITDHAVGGAQKAVVAEMVQVITGDRPEFVHAVRIGIKRTRRVES